MTDIIPIGPSGPRTVASACRIAKSRGATKCDIVTTDGRIYSRFELADVFEDGLIGTRQNAPGRVALILFHSISVIEFGD